MGKRDDKISDNKSVEIFFFLGSKLLQWCWIYVDRFYILMNIS